MASTYGELLTALAAEMELDPLRCKELSLYYDIWAAQAAVRVEDSTPALKDGETVALQDKGESLLSFDSLQLGDDFVRLVVNIAGLTARERPDLGDELASLAEWAAGNGEEVRVLASDYLRSSGAMSGGKGDRKSLPLGDLQVYILNNALRPFLRARANKLLAVYDESHWRRGYCPVCGGWPDFAALEGEKGFRKLMCSRCDTEWSYLRLGCPFCGKEDGVSYFASENDEYRLYVCDKCHTYIKTVDLRVAPQRHDLTLQRLLTTRMDIAARQAGYHSI